MLFHHRHRVERHYETCSFGVVFLGRYARALWRPTSAFIALRVSRETDVCAQRTRRRFFLMKRVAADHHQFQPIDYHARLLRLIDAAADGGVLDARCFQCTLTQSRTHTHARHALRFSAGTLIGWVKKKIKRLPIDFTSMACIDNNSLHIFNQKKKKWRNTKQKLNPIHSINDQSHSV